jgi:hypothetical protein
LPKVVVAFTATAMNSWGLSSEQAVLSGAITPVQGLPQAPAVTSVTQSEVPPGVTVSWLVFGLA